MTCNPILDALSQPHHHLFAPKPPVSVRAAADWRRPRPCPAPFDTTVPQSHPSSFTRVARCRPSARGGALVPTTSSPWECLFERLIRLLPSANCNPCKRCMLGEGQRGRLQRVRSLKRWAGGWGGVQHAAHHSTAPHAAIPAPAYMHCRVRTGSARTAWEGSSVMIHLCSQGLDAYTAQARFDKPAHKPTKPVVQAVQGCQPPGCTSVLLSRLRQASYT